MEHYDAEKAARVWARVYENPGKELSAMQLVDLANREARHSTTYRQLYHQSKNSQFLELARQEMLHSQCLRGLYSLLTQTVPPDTQLPSLSRKALYPSHLHCLAQYEVLSQDPEFGSIFTRLLRQEQAAAQTCSRCFGK